MSPAEAAAAARECTRLVRSGRTRIGVTVAATVVMAVACILAVIVAVDVIAAITDAAAHAAVNGYASYWDQVGQQVHPGGKP